MKCELFVKEIAYFLMLGFMCFQERNIFAWSRKTWKKEILLVAESKYAGRPLVSGMLAVSASREDPVIFYSPMGKKTIRTIYLYPRSRPDDAKKETFRAGFKLKTENKKILVGLAADVHDPQKVYVLTVDGEVMACHVGAGNLIPVAGVEGIPFSASQERVKLHTMSHIDSRKTSCLVIVEAERSGITILESTSTGIDIVETLRIGTGGVVAGFGFVEKGSLAVVAVSQARGNMRFFAWKVIACQDGSLMFRSCNSVPGSLWASLNSSDKNSNDIFHESEYDNVVGSVIHPKSGSMAFWTAATEHGTSASHLRFPIVSVVDSEDVGTPKGYPLHSSPYFWIQGAEISHDGVVSELYFPRYAYLNTKDAVFSLDISQGTMSTTLRPILSHKTQHRSLRKSLHSGKKGVWLLFSEIIYGEHTGGFQFSSVLDREAALQPGSWWFPGKDGAFAGSRDEMVVILTNSGKNMMVFDTLKLATNGMNGLIGILPSPDENIITKLFKGPIARIPSPPKPKPDVGSSSDGETDEDEEDALQEWEAYESKRHEIAKTVIALTSTNKLYLIEVSHTGSTYHGTNSVRPKGSFQLPSTNPVVQMAWQSLMDPNEEFHSDIDGAMTATPCILAIMMSDRVLFLNDELSLVSCSLMSEDAGNLVSCLWVGPSLLVSTSTNQIISVSLSGTFYHGSSILMGPPVALLAVTGDRLSYAYHNSAGAVDTSHRAWDPMPMMLMGWAECATSHILPGGYERAKKSLISLLSSYGATKIPICALEGLSKCGFSDLAAAAATFSELTAMSEARKNIFQAAAGEWNPIVAHLMTEYEESEFYPDHPQESSPLYQKMVVLARACQLHGRFKQTRLLLEAAGAWRELLSLCVFQGDFEGLQRYASQGGRQAELLASHLLAVNEDAFRRSVSSNQPKFHGRSFIDDYIPKESNQGRDGAGSPTGILPSSEFPRPLELAPSDRLPSMKASLQLNEESMVTGKINIESSMSDGSDNEIEEQDPIDRVDRSKLGSYIGIAGGHLRPGCILSRDHNLHEAEESDTENVDDIDFDDEDDSALGAVQRVITASPGSDTATETSRSESIRDKEPSKPTKVQEETRAAFFASKKLIDDEFYSSDDESSLMGGESAATFAATTTSKLIFKIKSKEEIDAENNSELLKSAAQNLKLEEPVTKSSFRQLSSSRSDVSQLDESMLGTSKYQTNFEGEANTSTEDPLSVFSNLPNNSETLERGEALPEEMFSPMKPQEPAQVPTSDLLAGWNEFEALFTSPESKDNDKTEKQNGSSLHDFDFPSEPRDLLTLEVPKSVCDVHLSAQQLYLDASWQKAAREFGKAFFNAMDNDPNNDVFRRRCASEYAASLLMQRASKAKTSLGARLARHAAGLDLDMNMQLWTQIRAAEMNIKAGNKEWSAELLSTILLEVGGEESSKLVDIAKVQKLLLSCNSNPSNKSVPPDEDINSTRMIIEVSQTLQDVDAVVSELSL